MSGLLELAGKVDIVYSPLVDTKEFPENVDIDAGRGRGQQRGGSAQDPDGPRAHASLLVSLGDCAVTGNVPAHAQSVWP